MDDPREYERLYKQAQQNPIDRLRAEHADQLANMNAHREKYERALEATKARERKLLVALTRISEQVPCRGDHGGDCAYCGAVEAMDDVAKHDDDCPWKIARVAVDG